MSQRKANAAIQLLAHLPVNWDLVQDSDVLIQSVEEVLKQENTSKEVPLKERFVDIVVTIRLIPNEDSTVGWPLVSEYRRT
jgi:hypothetical protein